MIYLVRHGEAAASWGDHPDPGLSELGQGQARSVAKILRESGARSAICSPMQRCRETAAPFERDMRLMARIEPLVSEIVTPKGVEDRVSWLRGVMSGTWDEADAAIKDWRRDMVEAVSALPDETVVFSHFVAINAIVSALEDVPQVTAFRPGHCSVTELARTGNRLIVKTRGSEAATKVL